MKEFYAYIDKCVQLPKLQRRSFEKELWKKFGVKKAVFILDMSGFTVSVQRNGLVDFLCKIRVMHKIVEKKILEYKGRIVKFEADNAYAVFDKPEQALQASVEVVRHFQTHKGDGVSVSVGISYGEVLLIPGKDFFGDAVNQASKLGEDLAQTNEILVSENVVTAKVKKIFSMEKLDLKVSGIKVNCFKIII